MADATQRSLVLRAQSGDREAFDSLLAGIGPPLLRYVTRVTGDPALAEDVVQETFIAIVRKISWLNDPSLFRAWRIGLPRARPSGCCTRAAVMSNPSKS